MSGAILTLLICTVAGALMAGWARWDARHHLVTSYGSDLRLLRSNWSKLGVALAAFLYISSPIGFSWFGFRGLHLPSKMVPGLPMGEFPLAVLNFAGIFAIGVLALNMLTGYAGQVSLGHATFIGAGAYAAGYFGQKLTVGGKHLPFLLWVIVAGIVGALISAIVGPFALRLRGDYLAVITVGLLVFAEHIFNAWADITGGTPGRSNLPQPVITIWKNKVMNFSTKEGESDFFGVLYSRNQGYFWLVWAFVAIAVILCNNIARSRQGRAMMAVRDRDLSAEAIGVILSSTKLRAFALCGGLAGISGALYGSYIQSVTPEFFNLNLSIQYVAMMIVGGSGTILGSVLGAVVVGSLDRVIDKFKWIFNRQPIKTIFFFFVSADSKFRPDALRDLHRCVPGLLSNWSRFTVDAAQAVLFELALRKVDIGRYCNQLSGGCRKFDKAVFYDVSANWSNRWRPYGFGDRRGVCPCRTRHSDY
jgi:branched-chain amino acid transport system permease protein